MNKIIWKYELEIVTAQTFMIPKKAVILTAQSQAEKTCLWVLCDPSEPKEAKVFNIYGTGHSVDLSSRKFIATVQKADGALVWHIFEKLS